MLLSAPWRIHSHPTPRSDTQTSSNRGIHYLLGQTVLSSERQSRGPWLIWVEEKAPHGFRCPLAKKLPPMPLMTWVFCTFCSERSLSSHGQLPNNSRQLSLALSTSLMGPRGTKDFPQAYTAGTWEFDDRNSVGRPVPIICSAPFPEHTSLPG